MGLFQDSYYIFFTLLQYAQYMYALHIQVQGLWKLHIVHVFLNRDWNTKTKILNTVFFSAFVLQISYSHVNKFQQVPPKSKNFFPRNRSSYIGIKKIQNLTLISDLNELFKKNVLKRRYPEKNVFSNPPQSLEKKCFFGSNSFSGKFFWM